jgi:hypothetical protein
LAKPVRELSKEDLMAIYDREGAAAALVAAKSQPGGEQFGIGGFVSIHTLSVLWETGPENGQKISRSR